MTFNRSARSIAGALLVIALLAGCGTYPPVPPNTQPIPTAGGMEPVEELEAIVKYRERRAFLDPVPYQYALDKLSVAYTRIHARQKAADTAELLLKNVRRYGNMPDSIPVEEAEYRLGAALAALRTREHDLRAYKLLQSAREGFHSSGGALSIPLRDNEMYHALLQRLAGVQRRLGYAEEADRSEQELSRYKRGVQGSGDLVNAGFRQLRAGEYAKSLAIGQTALTTAILDAQPQAKAAAELLLARSFEQLGDIPTATFWARASLETTQEQRVRIRARDNRNGFTQSSSGPYTTLARLLHAGGRYLEAEQVIKLLKADELEDMGLFRAGPGLKAPNALEQQALDENQQQQAQIVTLALQRETLEARKRAGRHPLSAEEEKTLDGLISLCAEWRTRYLAWLGTRRIANSALAAADPVVEPPNLQRLADGGDGIVAVRYVVDTGQVDITFYVQHAPLPTRVVVPAKDLARQVENWRVAVHQRKPTAEASEPLYAALIKPIEHLLSAAGAKTVVLALTGPLRALPFAALQDDSGRFLVERFSFAVHYDNEPVARERPRPIEALRLAGLGVTKAQSHSVEGRNVTFLELPHVRSELDGIKRLGLAQVDTWLDGDFSKRRFGDSLVPPYNAVHVASHFLFVPGSRRQSVLLLGSEVMSIAELAGFDYGGLDLITFSACGSGLTDGVDEDGVAMEGLGGVVLVRGAKTAVVTLWEIPDNAAPKLTEGFYRAIASKTLPRATALQQAQLEMLSAAGSGSNDLRHPMNWGAFVVMGEFR